MYNATLQQKDFKYRNPHHSQKLILPDHKLLDNCHKSLTKKQPTKIRKRSRLPLWQYVKADSKRDIPPIADDSTADSPFTSSSGFETSASNFGSSFTASSNFEH